jgi:HK97 gp10 family phage protein
VSKSFGSLAHLATHLAGIAVAQHEMEKSALEKCAKLVEKRAKEKLGEYQDAAGPFAGWAPLAESTMSDRSRQGFPEDEPLLRTGALRDSIEHTVADGVAQVGSDSDVAVYQELGTRHMPPRSFLGGAAAEKLEEIKGIIGESAVAALVGEHVHNRRMEIE